MSLQGRRISQGTGLEMAPYSVQAPSAGNDIESQGLLGENNVLNSGDQR
jgi:hypothetical protein